MTFRSRLTTKEMNTIRIRSMKYLKPNPSNMWLKLALFSALFSIAAPQQTTHREIGVHESSLNEGFKSFTSQRQMADFSWNITTREGFPVIAFNDSTENSEVQFMYDYTGTLTASKTITVLLYQYDCVTPADSSLVLYADYGTPGEISVDLDILQDTIATSVLYNETDDGTAATIEFCIRADYKFESDSLNFYETVVSINVDLTANFTLEAITIERSGADDASSTLDCDVEIYYCYQNHTEVIPAPSYRQGSALEVCIRVVEEDTSCCIKDIAEMDVDQDQDGDGDWDAHTDPITTTIADPLSSKLCSDDVCFVKTQLPSKFFSVRNPKNLTLSGVAILKLCDASLGSQPETVAAPSAAPSSQPTDGGIRALATATITVTATATDPLTLTNTTTTRTITQVTRASADITTKTTTTTLATTTSAVGSEPEETSNTSAVVEELPGYGALVPVAVATATAIEGPTPFVATATATATATAGFTSSATATGTAISVVGPAATATSTATTTATRTTTEATSLATATDTTPLGTLPTATDTQTGTDTVTAESVATTTATSTATSTFTEA